MREQHTKENIHRLLQLFRNQGNSTEVLTECLAGNSRIRSVKLDGHQMVMAIEVQTEVCYNKLFKLLIDKDMTPKELAEKAEISPGIVRKMRKGEGTINTGVWSKICCALECSVSDILEIIPSKS